MVSYCGIAGVRSTEQSVAYTVCGTTYRMVVTVRQHFNAKPGVPPPEKPALQPETRKRFSPVQPTYLPLDPGT